MASLVGHVSLLIWNIRCVLTHYQGGKTSALILEKQLLVPIDLERVSKRHGVLHSTVVSFPRKGLPPASLPRSQREKLLKSQELHLRLYRSQLAY